MDFKAGTKWGAWNKWKGVGKGKSTEFGIHANKYQENTLAIGTVGLMRAGAHRHSQTPGTALGVREGIT